MPHLTRVDVDDLLNVDGFGVAKFFQRVCDEDAAFDFARHCGLLNLENRPDCSRCGRPLQLIRAAKEKCRYVWDCGRPCRKKVHVTSNTVLECSKLPYMTILELMLQWFFEVPVTVAAGQAGVAKEAAVSWYHLCRQICDTIMARDEICIGGEGLTVEIDETHKSHRKYHRGRVLASEDVWIFGGICRETREGFLQVVPYRKGETLWPIIESRIYPGTVIMHDDAAVYRNLHLPDRGSFDHHIINHSQNFVDPNDRTVHTNTIERRWGLVKGKIVGFPGEKKLDMYLGEFLYRENFLKASTDKDRRNRGPQFKIFLRDVAKVFPGFGQICV